MANKKRLKRELKKIWNALKQERRERAKLAGAAEVAESAQRITGHASQLTELAKRLGDIEAVAPRSAPAANPKQKAKSKTKAAQIEPGVAVDAAEDQ